MCIEMIRVIVVSIIVLEVWCVLERKSFWSEFCLVEGCFLLRVNLWMGIKEVYCLVDVFSINGFLNDFGSSWLSDMILVILFSVIELNISCLE